MNLKERGITVGDLLILLIIILATSILVKNLNKDKKSTLNIINQDIINKDIISYKEYHHLKTT